MRRAIIAIVYCAWSLVPATSSAEPGVKHSGVLALSYVADNVYVGPEASVQLRAKTRRKHGLRAEMKLDARYFRSRVVLEDLFFDYKATGKIRFELGVNKKVLGLGYQRGRRKRLLRHRGLVYRSLEEQGIVGRQLNLKLRTEPSPGLGFDVALGADGSRNFNGSVSVRCVFHFFSLGYWGQVERHRINKGYLATHAHALSAWHQSKSLRLVAELFAGVNPDKSALEEELGTGERVHFVGHRFELAYRLELADALSVEPAARVSRFHRDVEALEGAMTQWTGAINVRRHELVVAPSLTLFQEHHAIAHQTVQHWQVRTDAQYFF